MLLKRRAASSVSTALSGPETLLSTPEKEWSLVRCRFLVSIKISTLSSSKESTDDWKVPSQVGPTSALRLVTWYLPAKKGSCAGAIDLVLRIARVVLVWGAMEQDVFCDVVRILLSRVSISNDSMSIKGLELAVEDGVN
jgi:hypothetical protein